MNGSDPTSTTRFHDPTEVAAKHRSAAGSLPGKCLTALLSPLLALACLVAMQPTAATAEPALHGESAGLGAASGPAAPSTVRQEATGLAGKVRGQSHPLDEAKVYIYHLTDFSLERTITDEAGRFLFQQLPAGLYKVIAHKPGFVPAVLQITRTAADVYQFLDLELATETGADANPDDGFWAVRSSIPADVLREMAVDGAFSRAHSRQADRRLDLPVEGGFATTMQAMTGVDQIASADAGNLYVGNLGVAGQVGSFQLDFNGDYRQLTDQATATTTGQASALSLRLDDGDDTRVSLLSTSNRLEAFDAGLRPVDFEHYQVQVTQEHGDRSRSEIAAQYTEESNFYRHGRNDPLIIPDASRIFRLQGSFATQVGESTHLETGLRYWQREYEGLETGSLLRAPGTERVDFFGEGGTQVLPAVVVEYGLYTTLNDGSLSLAPRGGVLVKMTDGWQAAASVSQRIEQDTPVQDFLPNLHRQDTHCGEHEQYCYRLTFTHTGEDEEQLTFGAMHREYAETLRLYFSDDFFDRLESLYLVPGDEVPEVQVSWTRRLAPKVLARLESNLAAGGGGIFYATNREPYENEVRYLVTSLDTQFQSSSTGLFIAFHHLQQELNALGEGRNDSPTPLATERLQLMLTQDLNVLMNLTNRWAVHLNMELSRGSDPFDQVTDDEELRKRILGGIAVKF